LSKRDEHDVADALLAKAVGDEAGLRALVDNHDVPDHVAGFLAQQAIEKAIKAVLIARDVPFERKHDIDYLCSLIEATGLDLTSELSAAVALTPWAVEFRYADPFDAPAARPDQCAGDGRRRAGVGDQGNRSGAGSRARSGLDFRRRDLYA
jgi:hypothetical protein